MYANDIKDNIKNSKKNKSQIKYAIKFFKQKGDSLQQVASNFILKNIGEHSFIQHALYDSEGNEIEWDVLLYKNYDSMIAAMDSLEAIKGELIWKRKEKVEDVQTISGEVLIENVELAFEVWKEKPWAKNYSYEIFKEYILPYRGSNEPIESWRGYFMNDYRHIESKMNNIDDPVEAVRLINNDLKSWFKFDSRFYCHPTDQGLFSMLMNKVGRCEDMTNLAIYAMRANGIAVTSDYTPHWADTGNNHAWNVVITPDGKTIPFMGCEENPGKYSLRQRMAKVYRKTYSKQTDNLAFKLENEEKAPTWLSGKCYIDVTREYTNVSDVTLTLKSEIPDGVHFAYLCVFNSGEWKAIHWGRINSNSVTFTEMGVNLVYLPMFYVNEELIPAGEPFILRRDKTIRTLKEDGVFEFVKLTSVRKKNIEKSSRHKTNVFLDEGCKYELFYWENDWKSLGVKTAKGDPLVFRNVPENCLYWLVKKDSKKEERIFTYHNDKQFWW